MGGAIVLSFLYHSAVVDRVKGVILDSPALDFEALIDDQATRQVPVGEPLRGALTALVLLFHGSDDGMAQRPARRGAPWADGAAQVVNGRYPG